MRTLGVLSAMQQNPELMSEAFVFAHSGLDATTIESVFIVTNWSESGSNRFRKEKRTLTHWRDLLQDLEGQYGAQFTVLTLFAMQVKLRASLLHGNVTLGQIRLCDNY